jgi:universal stress protein A
MYQQILVAVDLSKESSLILKKASALANLHHAKLHVLHVDQSFLGTYDGLVNINEADFEARLEEESINAMRALFADNKMLVDKYFINSGNIDDEILHALKQQAIDLVVFGHHKSSALRQFFLSISEPIIREMPCDVVLLKI